MVLAGDRFEEKRRMRSCWPRIGRLKVPVFMFQEGRDQEARSVFQAVAEASGGAYHAFDQGSAKQLAELLRAVAAFAVGGVVALEKQGTAAARLLSVRSAGHTPHRWHAMGGDYRRGATAVGTIAPNRVRREGGISPRLVPAFYVLKRR